MDRRYFVKSTGTLLATGALPGKLPAQPQRDAANVLPAADISGPGPAGEKRYVICEAYPPGYTARHVEDPANPIFKNLAYSSGLNYPTRPLPEYFKYTQDPIGFAHFDVAMAKAAGIDAFCFGDTSYGYQTQFTETYWAYWQAARDDGSFKIVPYTLLFNKGSFDPVRWDRFTRTWSILSKNYLDVILQIDGKYALHSWTALPTDDTLTPDDEIDSLLEQFGGPDKVYMIQQTTYMYAMTPIPGTDTSMPDNPVVTRLKATIQKYANAMTQFQEDSYGDLPATMRGLETIANELGKEVIYTAMPGFFQSRWQFAEAGHPGGRLKEKLGIAGYYYQWRHAIDSNARIVYLTTWNDVTEDHSIMPEQLHGYAYHELTKYFIQWFKAGSRPPVETEKILMFHHPQLTEKPLQVPPGGLTAGRVNSSSTPPADYIGVVVMLKSPATVTVQMGVSSCGIPYTQLASRDFPAGVNFWLIFHPLSNGKQSAIQDINNSWYYSKDDHPVYPEEQDDFFITQLSQGFDDREVFLIVDRDQQNIGYFTSHRAIVGAASAGNLGTVGNVFNL